MGEGYGPTQKFREENPFCYEKDMDIFSTFAAQVALARKFLGVLTY